MKGQVYLLTSIETGLGYIGSSINLTRRLREHRSKKKNDCTSKLLGPFEYMILEEYIDDDITYKKEFKKQLTWLERNYQDLYKEDIVNKMRAQVNREEGLEKNKEYSAKYKIEHREEIKELNAKYQAEHSEKINEKFICECGGKFTHKHKARHFKTKKHKEYIVIK
jgi:predicted GIY-YIG superfamily endonuclease